MGEGSGLGEMGKGDGGGVGNVQGLTSTKAESNYV